MVAILVVDALVATGHLITVLVRGGQATDSAEALLVAGAVVWVSNIVAFALLYERPDPHGSGGGRRAAPRLLAARTPGGEDPGMTLAAAVLRPPPAS